MYQKHEIGKWGEDKACQYLEDNNYDIVERNFDCKQGEIDIIAWDKGGQELVFIEVKTRTNLYYGTPVDAVNLQKQKHIYSAAQYYIFLHKIKNVFLRFDVIEVYVRGKYKSIINHIKQIF